MKLRSWITIAAIAVLIAAIAIGAILLTSREELPGGDRLKLVLTEEHMVKTQGEKKIETTIGAMMGVDPCPHDKEIRTKAIADLYSERNVGNEDID
ncbi:MAG: hypothetical protein Q4B99_03805 [Clostridia bacterium]|nr:hypothetical protein [Clostridia bacterium]